MHSLNRFKLSWCITNTSIARRWINAILLNYAVHTWTDRRRESLRSWGDNKNERSEKRVARSDGWWRRLRSRQTPRTFATFDRQFLSSFRMRRARSSSLLPPLSLHLSFSFSPVPLSFPLFSFSSSTFSSPSRAISSLFRSSKEALRAPPSSFVFLSRRL